MRIAVKRQELLREDHIYIYYVSLDLLHRGFYPSVFKYSQPESTYSKVDIEYPDPLRIKFKIALKNTPTFKIQPIKTFEISISPLLKKKIPLILTDKE